MPKRSTANFKTEIRARLHPAFVFNRKSLTVITIAFLLASVTALLRIRDQAERRLEAERALLTRQNVVPFEKKLRSILASKELTVWQSYQNTRAVMQFQDSYFVATDGGLVELDASGKLLRHYTVLEFRVAVPGFTIYQRRNFSIWLSS
jgi:hypothetical protein